MPSSDETGPGGPALDPGFFSSQDFASAKDFRELSKSVQELSAKFLLAQDWLEEFGDRLRRIEKLLLRTPIANFVHIDKVIDELVTSAERAANPDAPELSPRRESGVTEACCQEELDISALPASSEADTGIDVFTTAREVATLQADGLSDIAGKTFRSDVFSSGALSTDIGSRTVDTSFEISAITDCKHFTMATLRQSMEPEQPSEPVRYSAAETQAPGHDDSAVDIFPETNMSSSQCSALDPTWTEPLPRGLELSVGMRSSTPASSSWQPSRTPGSERAHDAEDTNLDDRSRS